MMTACAGSTEGPQHGKETTMTTCRVETRYLIPILGMILGVTSPSYAVDGVLQINQACAVNTGCFAGDSAAFPVAITQTGSYRLTGDLTVDENTTAIQITADNVTLDLNGFAIAGPTVCQGNPFTCTPSGTGVGILSSNRHTEVSNGTVSGMGSTGLLVGFAGSVERVRAVSNGSTGISGTTFCSVRNNLARSNGGAGIAVSFGSNVIGNVAGVNAAAGIFVGGAGHVTHNSVTSNGGNGIQCTNAGDGGCVVSENSVAKNDGFGLLLTPNSGYVQNVITQNNGGTGNPQVSGGIEIGTNLCDTNTTCP
jgi:hypothetical protein